MFTLFLFDFISNLRTAMRQMYQMVCFIELVYFPDTCTRPMRTPGFDLSEGGGIVHLQNSF